MKSRLLWKLLAVNLPVIVLVILVVWLSVDFLAADYFAALMRKYNISPTEIHRMFLEAVHHYIINASLLAIIMTVASSFLLTRSVLRPLYAMAEVSRKVSLGDFTARAEISSKDEVGEFGLLLNQMADNLEKIENSRKTMLGDIAHELRTPLTTVRGYIEGLADGVIPPAKETFGMLKEEILRLARLVQDIQQLTWAEAAKVYLRREEIELSQLFKGVIELYRHDFEANDIKLNFDFNCEAHPVEADRDKIVQVLGNIVQNAWKYTPEKGEFRVRAEKSNDWVKLIFSNTCNDFPKEDAGLIFERFYRAEKSRSRESGGAGIGLAIVKTLIEAHGGETGAWYDEDKGFIHIWFSLPAW
ncbi:MAG: ATP-binding protein [Nitrospinae bacterium]|nr:ATP-binding protein [Nitrospinota bacterium]